MPAYWEDSRAIKKTFKRLKLWPVGYDNNLEPIKQQKK